MNFYDEILQKMKENDPHRLKRIQERTRELIKEVDMKVKHGAPLPDAPEWAKANKANASYVNTKPTEEDVERLVDWCYDAAPGSGGGAAHAEATIRRLWQEIEDLRSMIEKKIY